MFVKVKYNNLVKLSIRHAAGQKVVAYACLRILNIRHESRLMRLVNHLRLDKYSQERKILRNAILLFVISRSNFKITLFDNENDNV